MKRRLLRFNGFEMRALLEAAKHYEMLKRRRYDPEMMCGSMNPDYWRDYLDEIGRTRLLLRDCYKNHIDGGKKVREYAVSLTDAQAMIIEHAVDEWRRTQKDKNLNKQEYERFIIQEAEAHSAQLRIRRAFHEENKAAV